MIWHPAAIAVLFADALGLLLLVMSASTAFRVVLHWSPGAADRQQLALERKAEAASIRSRWALGMFAFAGAVLLIGISHGFVCLVPGAMCGTGVMQAMGPDAAPALLLRGLLLWLLLLWSQIETLNQRRPDQPITPLNARILLSAVPVGLLALGYTYRGLQQVDLYRPVDCCAVVYDQFRTTADARGTANISDPGWIAAFVVLSALLTAAALWSRFQRSGHLPPKLPSALAMLTFCWIPVAAVTLVNVLAAYHYEVLQHQCPWCLFLPEHHRVGYPLYGALAVIAFEASVIWTMPKVSRRFTMLAAAARRRQHAAAGRLLLALAVFLLFAGLPPLLWRLRYGVWMGG